MNISLKRRIMSGYLVIGVLTFVLVGVTFFFLNRMENITESTINHYLEYKDISRKINIAMLEARRSEKDFLMREDKKYISKVSDQVKKVIELSKAGSDLLNNQESVAQNNEITALIKKYNTSFMEVADNIAKRGDKDTGVQGSLRASIHEVESLLNDMGIPQLDIDLLLLRRHEKDFMLRGDEKLVEKFKAEIEKFQTDLEAKSEDSAKILKLTQLIANYNNLFLEFVKICSTVKEKTEIFRAAAHSIEPEIEKNVALGEKKASESAAILNVASGK